MNDSNRTDVSHAMDRFFRTVKEKEVNLRKRREMEQEQIHRKSLELVPVRELLKRLIDMGLMVNNSDRYELPLSRNMPPVPFDVYESDSSSKRCQPGISLFFDHPAKVEIAVPNEQDKPELGVLVVAVGTDHPDRNILTQRFRTVGQVCDALAEFLAKNTQHIRQPPEEMD